MKVVKVLFVFLHLFSVGFCAEEEEASEPEVKLPPTLNKDNFDETLANGLHLVEFFSPYCPHCNDLEPKWKKVYKEYTDNPEFSKYGIDLLQVNCVEQGELCDRESIKYYPNMRLYGPNEHHSGGVVLSTFPGNLEKTDENIKKFIIESAFEFGDTDKLNLPSKSKLLSTEEFTTLLSGKYAKPMLVSLWPSNDKNFGDINVKKHEIFDLCEPCAQFQSVWNILSNQLSDVIELGHVNCETNEEICKELGYKELLRDFNRPRAPKIITVLPRTSGNLIRYSGDVSRGSLNNWVKRLLVNYNLESVDPYDLSQKMKLVNRLVNEPKNELPGDENNKVSYVYYYKDSTQEDFQVLSYLLDPLMKFPDTYLYKSNETGFEQLIERQFNNLLKYIHYNESEPLKTFNKELFISNTITSVPTIIGFKDNCLIPYVFQNFEPKDIRNPKLVEKFVKENSLPFISELTPKTFNRIFNLNNNNIDKVVVAFFDTTDPGHSHDSLNKLQLTAHDYYYHWSEFLFKDLQKKRAAKARAVEALKKKNAKSTEITKAMAKEVTYEGSGETVFTYLDLAKFRNMIDEKGWNISGKKTFQKGDVIIIERTGKFYYENDIYGRILKLDPWILRNTLMSFHDKKYKVKPLKKNLINSPYGNYLRHMDYIHSHGAKGYLFVVACIAALFLTSRRFSKRNISLFKYRKLNNKNLGILGSVPTDKTNILNNGEKHD